MDKEPKNFVAELTKVLSAQLTSLSCSISDFWNATETKPALPISCGTTGALDLFEMENDRYHISADFFLHHFLTSVPDISLQNCCANETLSLELTCYAVVLQNFMVLSSLVEGLEFAVQLLHTRPSMRSSMSILTNSRTYTVLERLTEEVFLGSQQELCR